MKRLAPILLSMALVTNFVAPLRAQDAGNSADAVAQKEDADERYKRLAATVEDLVAAQAAQQKKINVLAQEIQNLRDENLKAASANVTKEELRSLAEKLKESERQREADKKLIVDEIAKLGKAPIAAPSSESHKPKIDPTGPVPDKGYEYAIVAGDTLSGIVAAYRKEGVKTTQALVEKANPNVNWNKLRIGQKIFIPTL